MPVLTVPINVEETSYELPTEWRMLGAQGKSEHVIALCKKNGLNPKRILEVGAGDGAILRCLSQSKFGVEMYAVEISKSGVDVILGQEIPGLVSCQTFDGYNIPFADQFFDLVILSHVLEHVEFERALLRELRRVGKYQVIEIPMDCNDLKSSTYHLLGPSYGHINAHTTDSLRFLLSTEGFVVIDDLLGRYSLALLEYNHFTNNNQPRNSDSVKQFHAQYKRDEASFATLPRVKQESRSSYYAVLSREETPAETISRALKGAETSIAAGQLQAGRLIFNHYIPPQSVVQGALQIAKAVSGTNPPVALEFLDRALAIEPSNPDATALKESLLKSSAGNSPPRASQSPAPLVRVKNFVKDHLPWLVRLARLFRG